MSAPMALADALADRYRLGGQLGAGGIAPLRDAPEFARIAARAAARVAEFRA